MADEPNGIQFLLGFGVDNIIPHLEKVKASLSETQLAEYGARFDQISQQIRTKKAKLKAELETKRSAATVPWQLGLSWAEAELRESLLQSPF